ncbi:solute carrier family 2, facilitated glucose transporter member 1 [Aplysia californica]|uniref:Solute carrier family 2, facilitated glucose transporter member 1 n=1 Tax=Aplysia californica TaxID=6500 RepID=A0ABM1ACR2_APLCA|nr:solute carrier family 2, facilitated glucose transporter member 1 [Aplysia californica]
MTDKTGKYSMEKTQKEGWPPKLLFVIAAVFSMSIGMTYIIGEINSPADLITDFMNTTQIERTGEPMTRSDVDSMFGLLAAILGPGVIVGGITISLIGDRIGKKPVILMTTVLGSAAVLIMGLSKPAKSTEMLYVGRFLGGFVLGFSVIGPSYVAELCQPHQRAVIGMINMILQGFGFIISQVLAYEELLGTKELWPYLLAFPAIVYTITGLFFATCPESPRYLLMNKKDEEGAAKALRWLRGKTDVTEDIKELYEEAEESKVAAQISVLDLFRTPLLRRPTLVMIVIGIHQNWSGTNGILLFSNSMFRDAGFVGKEAKYATSGIGLALLAGNIIAVFCLPRFGRKKVLISATAVMGVLCAVVALTLVFKDEVDALKYINVVVSLLIMTAFAAGPICIFWILPNEIFPHSARGPGFIVANTIAFTGFFIHAYVFPALLDLMGSYTFFLYTVLNALMIVFCVFLMPETMGKSFPEIAKSWSKTPPPEDLMEPTHHQNKHDFEFEIPEPSEKNKEGGKLNLGYGESPKSSNIMYDNNKDSLPKNADTDRATTPF